ncbi:MAG TPA: carboxypeptidase-like regulatory domain-containing protein [Kofleriaceae bacterium]|nr:carboxypeptidase-like regulatory domain-containing protein [Kofleriaceae bacterium]
MKKLLVLALLAFAPSPAFAQPADALGHPLPAGDLTAGNVQVKVIAGSIAKPVADTEVHFAIDGVDRPARTNAEGHATIPGVAPNAKVKITVKNAKGEDVSSDEFPMPPQGGVKVMLSTTPMEATPGPQGGGPMMGGGGGMPDPRMMSGKGRADQTVDPGTLIATVTYGDLTAKDPPADVPVVLVGYSDAKGVTGQVVNTDASGRALFKNLDRSGATAYFILTKLGRGNVIDRLETIPPLQLGATAGWRVMLSGEKRDSQKPAVDELAKLETPAEVAVGKVLVSVAGVPQPGATAQLVDALTGKVIASAPLAQEKPHDVKAETAGVIELKGAGAGSLGVQLMHPNGANGANSNDPVPDAVIAVRSGEQVLATATSAKDGWAQLDKLPTGAPLVVDVTIHGSTVQSSPVTLPADKGQQINIILSWQQRGELTALFDAPDVDKSAYFVQTEMFKKVYRSEPFQTVPMHGTAASILVYPRVFLQFALDAGPEDDYLAVRGEMAVRNFSWAPYVGGPDGLSIPLPDGFKGAGVMEESEVAKDERGYRVIHPIPPFGISFHIGFSLTIDDRTTEWDMPLPIGVLEGDLAVRKFPLEVTVTQPKGVVGMHTEEVQNAGNTYFVMHDITLMPRPEELVPHLRFVIHGLPSPPEWKILAPKIAGLLVLLLITIAAWIAISAAARAGRARETEAAARKQRIDKLYEQLVAIDQAGGSEVRREQILRELEELLAAERERAK